MANMPNKKVDTDYDFQQITKERLVWLLKPLFVLGLAVWCLHPSTTAPSVVSRNMELGFVLGALFGILINRKALIYFLFTRRKETKHRKNRMPDEYYFGKVKEVLHMEQD